MSVIPITVFFSLLLVAVFVVLFLREQRTRRLAGAERDSLLPLADERARLADGGEPDDHDHDHAHDRAHAHARGTPCGCRDGTRPPCAGCLKRDPAAGR